MCLNAAKAFDEYVEPPKRIWHREPSSPKGDRPGDLWAARTSWHEILEPFGFTAVKHVGDVTHWERPGKDLRSTSATTNHDGYDLFYVFSSNAPPFEPKRGYSKFTAFTLLRCQGDFSRAAKLAAERVR